MSIAAYLFGALTVSNPPAFAVTIHDLSEFSMNVDNRSEVVAESGRIDPGAEWDELVPSWDIDQSVPIRVGVEVRVLGAGTTSPYFHLGMWSHTRQPFGSARQERTSINGQSNPFGSVSTDTLVVSQRGRALQVRLTFSRTDGNKEMTSASIAVAFHGLTLSFRSKDQEWTDRRPNFLAWGKVLEPPRRSQMSYPNGSVICSPTATSMVLGFWAEADNRPNIDRSVPDVVAGVYDPAYRGTGNWPFNTAFASAQPGMTGCVLRLNDLRDLEDLTSWGFPVVCSVSSAMLKGAPEPPPSDGHLVVLVGFDAQGDPVFNDPGRTVAVRQTYRRQAFQAAWNYSARTVYLIHPESRLRPRLSVDRRL